MARFTFLLLPSNIKLHLGVFSDRQLIIRCGCCNVFDGCCNVLDGCCNVALACHDDVETQRGQNNGEQNMAISDLCVTMSVGQWV